MLEIALSPGDPRCGRFILQVVAKPSKDAALVIDLIGFFAEAVVFAGVFDEDNIFPSAASNVVEFDALMEKHGAVTIADFDEKRRGHALHAENRGVADVSLEVLVERNFHPLLTGFDVIGLGSA